MKKKRRVSLFRGNALFPSLLPLLLLLAAAAALLLWGGLQAKKELVFPGVTACGRPVGGMDRRQLLQTLEDAGYDRYRDGSVTLLFPSGHRHSLSAARLGLEGSCAAAADMLLAYGRCGRFLPDALAWCRALFRETVLLPLPEFQPDRAALQEFVAEVAASEDREPVESVLFLEGEVLRWTRGRPGLRVQRSALLQAMEEAFRLRRFGTLEWVPEVLEPEASDAVAICRLITREPVDARFDERFQVLPEQPGRSFDAQAAQAAMDAAAYGETLLIPLQVLEPQVYAAELQALLYRDSLAHYESSLTANEVRSRNIQLAAQAIDGMILLPGETFSYNDAVGERTAEKGYGEASAYSGGQVVQELGGGVCQLSSALYYCCMLADLEIVFRTGHSYSQSYVPPGMDATVSWGWPDFSFRNDKEYPIRICARREDSRLLVSLEGTRTWDSRVELEYEVEERCPCRTVYRESSALPAGTQQLLDAGRDGMLVTTYRCRYDAGGALLSREEEAVSQYSARDRVILVGTG